VIALSRGVFQSGGNVTGFEQRVVFENFLPGGPCGQQFEHVLDADAQASEARSPAALVGIDGYAVQFAHPGPPE
jgi:hypothetical protein